MHKLMCAFNYFLSIFRLSTHNTITHDHDLKFLKNDIDKNNIDKTVNDISFIEMLESI